MTSAEISAAWRELGALAQGASFRAVEDASGLHLIADAIASKVGVGRAFRSVPLGADDATVLEALRGLSVDLGGVLRDGPALEGKSFKDVLER